MVRSKRWRPFEEAREFARSLGLRNSEEWGKFHKSNQRPADIPSNPRREYKGVDSSSCNSTSTRAYLH